MRLLGIEAALGELSVASALFFWLRFSNGFDWLWDKLGVLGLLTLIVVPKNVIQPVFLLLSKGLLIAS